MATKLYKRYGRYFIRFDDGIAVEIEFSRYTKIIHMKRSNWFTEYTASISHEMKTVPAAIKRKDKLIVYCY